MSALRVLDQGIIHILLIEDDEDDYVLTNEVLESAYDDQYRLSWVDDLSEAKSLLKQQYFDLILCDFRLGEETGLDMLRHLGEEGLDHIPIIILTGQGEREIDLQVMEEGATDYLIKFELTSALLERSIRYSIMRKQTEEETKRLAYHDALTGLSNRLYFLEQLEAKMSAAQRQLNYGALLFLDLDDFKRINDTLGHSVGDCLLVEVAAVLKSRVRKEDLVCRLGGDEFVILLNDLGANSLSASYQVSAIAQKIIQAINTEVVTQGERIKVGCSIGVALFGGRKEAVADNLMRQADIAMYRAKGDGKNHFCFFSAEMEEAVLDDMRISREFEQAIEAKELHVHYQPIVDLHNQDKIYSAEALIRWQHRDGGWVMPNDFIPVLERHNQIAILDAYVLREVCCFLKQDTRLSYITVNISAQDFAREEFVSDVEKILADTEVDPKRIVLELTESQLVDNIVDASEKMHQLKEYGIRFALDDFGTGYASLSMLKDLPFDILKIDRSFIEHALISERTAVFALTILSMGRILGMKVIAEGVSELSHKDFLVRNQARFAQGFLFAKALPKDELTEALNAEKTSSLMH